MDAVGLDPGDGFLLLLEEGVGDEVCHLEEIVSVGASEGGASDDVLDGYVSGPLAFRPQLVLTGHGVEYPEPAVGPGDHLLLALVEDEEGVSSRRLDRAVDAVEQPVEADLLVGLHDGLADADVDDLDAADADGGVLDAAQPVPEDLGPLPGREPFVGSAVAGEQAPSRQQIAGVKLSVRRDGVALLKLPSPLVDVAEQVVPPLGVHAQGGSDVAAGTLGLVDVVQAHGDSTSVWRSFLNCSARGRRSSIRRSVQARPVPAAHRSPAGPGGRQAAAPRPRPGPSPRPQPSGSGWPPARRGRRPGRWAARRGRRWGGGLSSSAGRAQAAPPSSRDGRPGAPTPGRRAGSRSLGAGRQRRRDSPSAALPDGGSSGKPGMAGRAGSAPSPGSVTVLPGRI